MSYRRCTTGFVVSEVCARSGNANIKRARANGPKAPKRHFIGFPPIFFLQAIDQTGIVQACADGKPNSNSAFRTPGGTHAQYNQPRGNIPFLEKNTSG